MSIIINFSGFVKRFVTCILAFTYIGVAIASEPTPDCQNVPGAITLEDSGLALHESVPWDKKLNYWYVSNIAGGFISRVNSNGTMDNLKWINESANINPRGMHVDDSFLYVASGSEIVVFDTATATEVKRYNMIPVSLLNNASLNDLVVDHPSNAIYATTFDFFPPDGGIVLKVPLGGDGSDASHMITPLQLGSLTNGIQILDRDLVVGAGDTLYKININTKKVDLFANSNFIPYPLPAFTGIDGLESYKGGMLYSYNNGFAETQSLLGYVKIKDKVATEQVLCTLEPGELAADIGLDKFNGVVSIPHLFSKKITFVPLGAIDFNVTE